MRFLVLALLVGCSSASYQTIKMTNRSPHTIESIYIYKAGSQDHGASKGSLAPNATLDVKVKEGNVEVLAVTTKESIGDGLRERKEASQVLELRSATELIFHNSDQKVVDRPGTIGVQFRILPTEKKSDEPAVEPAPSPEP